MIYQTLRRVRRLPAAYLICVAVALTGLPAWAADGYEEAASAFERGDYGVALIELKSVLQERQEDLPALILLGRTYAAMQRGAEAEESLERARRLGADPGLLLEPLGEAYLLQGKFKALLEDFQATRYPPSLEAQVLVLRARALLGQNEVAAAEKLLEDTEKRFPERVEARVWRARALLALDRRALAGAVIGRATKLFPDSADAWFVAGELERVRDEPLAAIANYARTLELDPLHRQALVARAALSIDQGDDAGALADVQRILELAPKHPQATYLKALLASRRGDLDAAQAILDSVVADLTERDPSALAKHAPSLLLLGTAHYRKGNWELARSYLERYLGLDPAHLGVRKMLGDVMVRQGDTAGGLALLETLAEDAPDDLQLLTALARGYVAVGQLGKAQGMLRRAIAVAPDQLALHLAMAATQVQVGDDERAHEALAAAIQLAPDDPRARLMLARLQIRRAQLDDALKNARLVLDKAPEDPGIHQLVGEILLRQNDLAGAKKAFESALARDADYLPAHEQLAAIDLARGNPEAAQARLEALAKRLPDNAAIAVAVARIAVRRGALEEAIVWLEKAMAKGSQKVAPFHLDLADLYLRTAKPDRALELAAQLTKWQPDSFLAWYALGRVQLARNEHADAIRSFAKAAKEPLSQASPAQRVALGKAQLAAGDRAGARAVFARAAQANDRTFVAHAALSAMDIEDQRADLALARATRLSEAYPDVQAGAVLAGDAQMALGRFDDAEASYARAERQDPQLDLSGRRHSALIAQGKSAEAIAELTAALRERPDDTDVLGRLAVLHLQVGNYRDSIKLHERLLQHVPESALALNNLAWLFEEVDDPRALETAELAVQRAPDSVAALDTLGWIHFRAGRFDTAVGFLRRARARDARDPRIAYHLASALAGAGKRSEARALVEEALQSGRDFSERVAARELLRTLPDG